MDFSFSEEQQMLRSSLRAFLQDRYAFEARRTATLSNSGWRPELWRALGQELGVLALAFPERVGGLDADAVSTLVVMEELGRALVVEPYLDSVVVCGGLLRRAGGAVADAALSGIGSGEQVMALAWSEPQARYNFAAVNTRAQRSGDGWILNGAKAVVIAAPWATQLLVTARTSGETQDRDGISLFLVDKATARITVSEYPTVDGRRAGDIVFNDVLLSADALIGEEGLALPLIEQVADEAIAALCAEALGVASRLLEDTIDYTRQRRQFGQPIAQFQALQHRMVDMYMQLEMARSATYLATMKLAADPIERALAASTAKVTVANACKFIGQNAVQLHGGMGMTDELAVSHYFRRATVIESEFGSADFHLARHVRLSR